jgi:hypothetical protein
MQDEKRKCGLKCCVGNNLAQVAAISLAYLDIQIRPMLLKELQSEVYRSNPYLKITFGLAE